MDLRFKEIDIQNFRSIEEAHVEFNNQGTVIVKGINEYEDNATSNGSGKSSIFEALIYSLFEETSSGEKDVANRIINNGFNIQLKFEIDDIKYTIIRRAGKNGKAEVYLYKNEIDISARNKSDTNKLILELLGINKNIFLDSVFLSQNVSTNLASLSPTQRKERLEILTNTDVSVNKFKNKLKQQEDTYESICSQLQMDLNRMEGTKITLQKQQYEIQQAINDINEQIKQRDMLGNLDDITQQIESLEQELDNCKTQIYDLDNVVITELDTRISNKRLEGEENRNTKSLLENNFNDKRIEYNNKQAEINQLQNTIQYVKDDILKIEQQIKDIKDSDKCPTCGRQYENSNEEHIQQIVEGYVKNIEEHNKQIQEYSNQIEQQQVILQQLIQEGSDLRTQLNNIDILVQQNNNEVIEIENIKQEKIQQKSNLQQQQQNIEQNINMLRNKKEQILNFKVGDPTEFELMLQNIEKDMLNIEQELKSKQQELNVNMDYIGSIKHSLQLITKEFRTYLLQNSITYLNNLLKKYSVELFSNETDIIHITQEDTKLNIQLGKATYESLSGGEKTRVNIALLLAQKSLANAIGNISCNIIILDEVLGYCDAQAEEKVINLITMELESLESIYMISHKEIPVGYDTQIVVIKDQTGLSKVRCY